MKSNLLTGQNTLKFSNLSGPNSENVPLKENEHKKQLNMLSGIFP
jgi:hypothetical protein